MENNNTKLALMSREVKDYNPSEHMISLPDRNGNPSQYLTVAHRKDWFFRWCQQEGLVGFIDEGEPEYDAQLHQLVAVSKILVDGKVIGQSMGGKPFNPNMPEANSPSIIQEVTTLAVGRALANCGFGTVGAIEDREPVNTLADAPVADCVENQTLEQVPVEPRVQPKPSAPNPMVMQTRQASSESKSQSPVQPQKNEATTSAATETSDAELLATLKKGSQVDVARVNNTAEAQAIVMPFGECKGMTLGDIAASPEGLHTLQKIRRNLLSEKVMPNLSRAVGAVIKAAQK